MKKHFLSLLVTLAAVVSVQAQAPAAPSDLYVDTALSTAHSLTIHWKDNSTNEAGFELFINGVSEGTGHIPANTTSLTIEGLVPNADYTFALKAYNVGATQFSGFSNSALGRTLKTAPTAPMALRETGTCATSVSLFWLDAMNEDSYAVERSVNFGPWVQIYTLAANMQQFTDNNAVENSHIQYRIIAINNGGRTASTPFATFTKRNVAPNAPYNLMNTKVDTTSAMIQWTPGMVDRTCNTNPIIDTQVWIMEEGGNMQLVQFLGADQYQYTFKNLKKSTKYTVQLKHRGNYGESNFSNAVTFRTLGPPTAPMNLTTTPGVDALGNSFISLMWDDKADTEEGYVVEASTDPNMLRAVSTTAPNINFFIHKPVDEGVTYYYRVYGKNKYGNSPATLVISGKADYSQAPNAPYNLKVKMDAGKPMLMWKDNSTREEMFEIERAASATAAFTKIGTVDRNVTMFTDATFAAGSTPRYRVRAVNPKGNSAYSEVAMITAGTSTTTTMTVPAESSLSIFPNPSASNLRVQLTEEQIADGGVVRIQDQNNRTVKTITLQKGIATQEFSIANLKDGVYLITVETPTSKETKRIVKQ